MNFMKSFPMKSIAVALALAVTPATIPAGAGLLGASPASAQNLYGGNVILARDHWRGGPRWRGNRGHWRGHRGHYRGHRYYRRHHHHGIGSGGAAVLGGIIGLGVGAAIASQPRYERAPRYYGGAPAYRSRAWYNYCSARYRSFDPRSGTYQPYNGPRRVCR